MKKRRRGTPCRRFCFLMSEDLFRCVAFRIENDDTTVLCAFGFHELSAGINFPAADERVIFIA